MKLVHVFTAVHMGKNHKGLSEVAKNKGVNLNKLKKTEACIFISRNRMRMKCFTSNGVLSYILAKENRPLSMDAIQDFPKAFSPDGKLNYDKALRIQLTKRFEKRGYMKEEKLGR